MVESQRDPVSDPSKIGTWFNYMTFFLIARDNTPELHFENYFQWPHVIPVGKGDISVDPRVVRSLKLREHHTFKIEKREILHIHYSQAQEVMEMVYAIRCVQLIYHALPCCYQSLTLFRRVRKLQKQSSLAF